MKKILIAFDGLNYKESAAQFAISLSTRLHSHLTGLFLNDRTYHSLRSMMLTTAACCQRRSRIKGEQVPFGQ
jgi:hypothetical protein